MVLDVWWTNMRVVEFSYFSKDDYSDNIRQARSRIYEYPFVINTIKELWLKNPKIHNTWCWGWEIHLDFARELENYWTVINSDNDNWRWKVQPNNYITYDLINKCNFTSEIVLCISTLEHLSDQVAVLKNLIEATDEWWYIIVTLDSPPVDIKAIEEYLWVECKQVENKLNQWNSKLSNPAFREEINVVKLVIQK